MGETSGFLHSLRRLPHFKGAPNLTGHRSGAAKGLSPSLHGQVPRRSSARKGTRPDRFQQKRPPPLRFENATKQRVGAAVPKSSGLKGLPSPRQAGTSPPAPWNTPVSEGFYSTRAPPRFRQKFGFSVARGLPKINSDPLARPGPAGLPVFVRVFPGRFQAASRFRRRPGGPCAEGHARISTIV